MKSNNIRKTALAGLAGVVLASSGCADWKNRVDRDGSLFGTTNGDYIVVNYSGGKIVDVWKLRNVHVNTEAGSDGWLFRDNNGDIVMVSGEQNVYRLNGANTQRTWDSYCEYHTSATPKSYQESCPQEEVSR